MDALKVKQLTKRFDGVKALNRLSLTFEAAKITAIIGPNGSGKTTLINILSGVTPFNDGTVVVAGVSLKSLRSSEIRNYGLTRTFQEVRLFNQMTVLDNILIALTDCSLANTLTSRPTDEQLQEAEQLLTNINLWSKRHTLAGELSYGQRKLLEISRALATKADIYLLDEPFAGLFPEIIEKVVAILQELKKQKKTVILIEHHMALIRRLADRVVVLDDGRMLAEGSPETVLAQEAVIEAYLGE